MLLFYGSTLKSKRRFTFDVLRIPFQVLVYFPLLLHILHLDINDLKKSVEEGGFEITEFDRKKSQLIKLLKRIQDEDGYIKVNGGKFTLLQKGIEYCKQLYPTMP
jgi:hypothetical protein